MCVCNTVPTSIGKYTQGDGSCTRYVIYSHHLSLCLHTFHHIVVAVTQSCPWSVSAKANTFNTCKSQTTCMGDISTSWFGWRLFSGETGKRTSSPASKLENSESEAEDMTITLEREGSLPDFNCSCTQFTVQKVSPNESHSLGCKQLT